MLTAGAPHRFSDGFLPPTYVPEILDLVLLAWQKVNVPDPKTQVLEPNISALLKDKLRDEMDSDLINVPFFIFAEVQSSDPITGKQLARSDIEFHCRNIKIPQDKAYFTFEAKCLQVPGSNGRVDANNSKYIEDMRKFINDDKKAIPSHCGMLGYIMSGDAITAQISLQRSLIREAGTLGMPPSGMTQCGSIPYPPHGETNHSSPPRVSGNLPIYHLLLVV